MRPLYHLVASIGSRLVRRQPDMLRPEFLSEKIKAGEIKKILIITLQQLGDNLVFTPALKSITEHLGHLQLDMLVNSVGYEVYKHFPSIHRFYVDRTWYWGKGERRILPLLKLILELRKEKYDLAILDATCAALKYPTIAFLTGARYRLGIDQYQRGFFNNIAVAYREHLNLVERNLSLLPFLGITPSSEDLFLPTSAQDRQDALEMMRTIKQADSDKVIVIHQGSNWSSKEWFTERWVELGQRLLAHSHFKLVFTGAAREQASVEAITAQLSSSGRVFSLVGKTTIHQLKEFIELSNLFITLDTGPMHIGNCTQTPMVVLMSAIDREHFWIQPSARVTVLRKEVSCKYCSSEVCPLGTKECMALISVDEVFEAAMALLSQPASPLPAPSESATERQ
jgi:ADP-heptose:LPS heptosyltransferase